MKSWFSNSSLSKSFYYNAARQTTGNKKVHRNSIEITVDLVPVAGVEPARCCHRGILSYLLHTEYRRTQPPVEVVDGHQKALPILLFLKLMCKKLRFVCHFRSFQFGRKFWILEGHRRDVTHKRSATAHAVDLSITNTL